MSVVRARNPEPCLYPDRLSGILKISPSSPHLFTHSKFEYCNLLYAAVQSSNIANELFPLFQKDDCSGYSAICRYKGAVIDSGISGKSRGEAPVGNIGTKSAQSSNSLHIVYRF